MLTTFSEIEFDKLVDDVSACRKCARMEGCVRVLSWANGSIEAPLMFIGEAPGRLGADRTAIPFHGDKSGDNFEKLLDTAGISRKDIFVTNAVLCNPKDEKGNNSPPAKREIENCVDNLQRQIELIKPALVMTLGGVALEATRIIEHHDLTLRDSVRTSNKWNSRLLLPLYHPGARAMIHRSFHNQVSDYYFVGETLKRLGNKKRRASTSIRDDNSWNVVAKVLKIHGSISLFRLHKILYLIDNLAAARLGGPITRFFYIRQKDGPYCVDLGGRWYSRFPDSLEATKSAMPILTWRTRGLFDEEEHQVSDEALALIREVANQTEMLNEGQLKTKVYLTEPMKRYLKMEKQGFSSLNMRLL
ncbi:uracil-DNA glycosylase [Sphingopyxis macrogoltabida]|uniref:Uracil-DNA glycosylase-like domain-containing protein n=1 Tax=Sphingopyxis macrogoltabida TaxID=33050 RepID=A0A0N9U4B1_SPHMC|nr:uracil-DNA glycosylase [Sphingopyxis macrogoltabida]ALH79902.1 hypothetical protein AN936_05850 [Sphingopyxis macrogoltabida]